MFLVGKWMWHWCLRSRLSAQLWFIICFPWTDAGDLKKAPSLLLRVRKHAVWASIVIFQNVWGKRWAEDRLEFKCKLLFKPPKASSSFPNPSVTVIILNKWSLFRNVSLWGGKVSRIFHLTSPSREPSLPLKKKKEAVHKIAIDAI
jgi:hypothetical protein